MNECYRSAIIGHTISGDPVYDYDAMISILTQRNTSWNEYDAAEWIDHNFVDVPGAPIIIRKLEV